MARSTEDSAAAAGCLLLCLYALAVIAMWVGIVYVAIHFIGKFW
jgi:hypothetical protein